MKTLNLPNSSADGGSPLIGITSKSALAVMTRRLGASLVDATILGALAAAMIFAQLSVHTPEIDLTTKLIGAGVAFTLAFLDVLTLSGILCLLGIIAVFLMYSESFVVCLPAYLPMVLVLNTIYYIAFEQSPSGATPGKRLLGLRAQGPDGSPPSALKAIKRHCAKTVSLISMLFPVVHFVAGSRHQLIHDRIAGIQIVESGNKNSPPATRTANDSIVLQTEIGKKVDCATLWSRLPAAILDSLSFGFLTSIVMGLCALTLAYTLPAANSAWEAMSMLVAVSTVSYLAGSLTSIIVLALFESSQFQATPGKLVMGLKVTNHSLSRITFKDAIYKQLIQIFLYVSVFPLIGIIFIPAYLLTLSLQLDAVVWITWLAWLSFYLIYGSAMCITFSKKRQSLLDVMCKRYVLAESKTITRSLTELK